jgi:hypothetical protein
LRFSNSACSSRDMRKEGSWFLNKPSSGPCESAAARLQAEFVKTSRISADCSCQSNIESCTMHKESIQRYRIENLRATVMASLKVLERLEIGFPMRKEAMEDFVSFMKSAEPQR